MLQIQPALDRQTQLERRAVKAGHPQAAIDGPHLGMAERAPGHAEVRTVMRERQRELADEGNAVIEGRDIGTVVAPDAEVKVYLVADQSVRAQRRQAERPEIGADALVTDLKERDARDAERTIQAEDAVLIDTTDLQVDDVVERIEQLVRRSVA